ncbi:MAG: hypothetical protein ACI9EB_001246 [Pseudomonas sp.]|jgi:hypothetical protein
MINALIVSAQARLQRARGNPVAVQAANLPMLAVEGC